MSSGILLGPCACFGVSGMMAVTFKGLFSSLFASCVTSHCGSAGRAPCGIMKLVFITERKRVDNLVGQHIVSVPHIASPHSRGSLWSYTKLQAETSNQYQLRCTHEQRVHHRKGQNILKTALHETEHSDCNCQKKRIYCTDVDGLSQSRVPLL